MRFDTILAQYLYQKKKLNLPGIGTFEADGSVYASEDHDRARGSLDGITFKNTQVSKADDDLIEFIKEHTGKMKPLAISDLESYLTLGKQFLYIGKPFYMEGIGTLSFGKKGFDFTPGEYVSTKLEDPNLERSENKKKALVEEDRVQHEDTNNSVKRFFVAFAIIAGIALAGWAGYYFYNQYMATADSNLVVTDSTTATPVEPDTTSTNPSPAMLDNLSTPATVDTPVATTASAPSGSYKYIAETTFDKVRAASRFAKLKSYGQKVFMDVKADSSRFDIYYIISSTPADTARIKDSINRAYYGAGVKRVKIQL